MNKFNVLLWDFNTDSLTYYDILPYFRNFYVINGKMPLKKIKEIIEEKSKYRFWARCEYEMICHGWPVQKKEHKLDVHEQVMMNIDIIAKLLYEEQE